MPWELVLDSWDVLDLTSAPRAGVRPKLFTGRAVGHLSPEARSLFLCAEPSSSASQIGSAIPVGMTL